MDKFIETRKTLIEAYNYAIMLYRRKLQGAVNGEIQILLKKIEVMEAWKSKARKEIQDYSFGSLYAVCQYFGITEQELKSRSRKGILPKARQYYSYFVTVKEKRLLTEAGQRILRDHSTILQGRDKIIFEMEYYPQVRRDIREIEKIMQEL